MNLRPKLKEIVEATSVGLVMIFVLLPVRLFFVRYIADDWLGSFGLITAISVLILILAKKDKLGWFGRAFHRQLYKVHRGKRRYFVYTNLILGFIFLAGTIYAIELGNVQYQTEKEVIKQQLPSENIQDVMKEAKNQFKIEDIPKGVAVIILTFVLRFDIFSVIMSTLNDLTDGWVLHFATVFFVEELEIIGLMIFYRFTVKSEKP